MRRAAALCLALAACPRGMPSGPVAPIAVRLVVSERGPVGGRLVVVDETGDRQAELLPPIDGMVRDVYPAFSPDGAHLVFASSRDRTLEESSLWAVAASAGATPYRLTTSAGSDLQPVFSSDGAALVFVSSRAGSLDLWRAPVQATAEGLAIGDAELLLGGPGEVMSPSTAPDGRIVFAELDARAGSAPTSRLRERAVDGTVRELTAGPADTSPAYAPDGARVVFARPSVRVVEGGAPRADTDLWLIDGGEPRLWIDLPATDEASPRWSSDGRFLFFTSTVRSDTGEPLLSSIVYVEVGDDAEPRILVDRLGLLSRTSPAIAPGLLDATALRAGQPYRATLSAHLSRVLAGGTEAAP